MTIRITWRRILLALLAVAAAGLGFAWSGMMQVSASSGHWAITDWFLHWTMRNSVRTHAALQKPVSLPDKGQLVSAAGHYRQACQICHGAPGQPPSPVMQRATPSAPDLARLGDKWTDAQLFWIIDHGVKMTGMPAWGAAGRGDEVGRMTAFVRRLPGMTTSEYRRLTEVDPGGHLPGVKAEVLARCTGCHGADGRGRGQGDIPILGGQKPATLKAALRDYASGKRASAVMQVAAASLSPVEIDRLSHHFAAMPGLTSDLPKSAHPVVTQGLPSKQLPACTNCHNAAKAYPVLFGQKPAYIAARLRQWQGDPAIIDARKSPETMPVIARRIPAEEIDRIALSLAPR